MNRIKLTASMALLLLHSCIQTSQQRSLPAAHNLEQVFCTPLLRKGLAQFLDNILRQIPSSKFFNVIDTIMVEQNDTTDQHLYKKFLEQIDKLTPAVPFYNKLHALNHQKKVLSDQICTLLDPKKK